MLVEFSTCCITSDLKSIIWITQDLGRWIKDEYKSSFISFTLDQSKWINKRRESKDVRLEIFAIFNPQWLTFSLQLEEHWIKFSLNWNWVFKPLPDCWLYTASFATLKFSNDEMGSNQETDARRACWDHHHHQHQHQHEQSFVHWHLLFYF